MLEVSLVGLCAFLLGAMFLVYIVFPLSLQIWEVMFKFCMRDKQYRSFSFYDWYQDKTGEVATAIPLSTFLISFFILMGCDVNDYNPTIDLIWLLTLGIPHTIRFVFDVCRNLKLNNKTGESERIAKMEAELAELQKGSK